MGATRTVGAPAPASPVRPPPTDPPRDLLLVAVAALALVAFFVTPLWVDGYRLPVGPDVPYYVWDTRLAGEVGLSVTGFRPGLHALLLDLSAASGLSVLQAVGALGVALAAAVGLAAGALADRGLGRNPARTALVGLVAGAYTARLASGFLANLLFAALFLAALTVLVGDRRTRATVVAGGLLAAAALAHAPFFAFGLVVLGGAVLLRLGPLRGDPESSRSDVTRIVAAGCGAAAVAAAGLFATGLGQRAPVALHERDALLRRAGLMTRLRDAYLDRWREALRAFILPITAPLGAIGAWAAIEGWPDRSGDALAGSELRERRRLFGALLLSWTAVTAVGILVGLITSAIPAGRLLAFALVVPFLAAIGAVALGRWISLAAGRSGGAPGRATRGRRRGRVAGALVTGGLAVAFLVGPYLAWSRAHPFTSRTDLQAVEAAARVAATLPPGTPLMFVVDRSGSAAAFELTRYGNVIRTGMPADRIPDVFLIVGGPHDLTAGRPSETGDPERDALARIAFGLSAPALARPHAAFLLRPFNQDRYREGAGLGREVAPGVVRVLTSPAPVDAPGADPAPVSEGISPAGLTLVAVAFLLALLATGLGWTLALLPGLGRAATAGIAPAVGGGAIVIVSVALDAVGIRLAGAGGVTALLLSAGLGYGAWAWSRREGEHGR